MKHSIQRHTDIPKSYTIRVYDSKDMDFIDQISAQEGISNSAVITRLVGEARLAEANKPIQRWAILNPEAKHTIAEVKNSQKDAICGIRRCIRDISRFADTEGAEHKLLEAEERLNTQMEKLIENYKFLLSYSNLGILNVEVDLSKVADLWARIRKENPDADLCLGAFLPKELKDKACRDYNAERLKEIMARSQS